MKRRILYWVLAAVALGFVATHTTQIGQLWQAMRGGDWRWLLAAAALQVIYYAFYIGVYQAAFAAVGVKRPYAELIPTVLGTFFVNVVTPTAGAAGTALVVSDAVRRGHPAAASTAAWLLAQLADTVSFAVIMVAGFAYLAVAGLLKTYEIVAAVILLALIALFIGLPALSIARPRTVERILRWASRAATVAYRVVRRPSPLPDDWATVTAEEFARSSRLVMEHPRGAAKAIGLGLIGYVFDVIGLVAVGYAFGWPHPGSLLAAYAVGVVLWLTSIVPQGVGIVEGAIAVVLVSFGALLPQATAISLVFRGLSFWIPMLLGFILLRRVGVFQPGVRSARMEVLTVRAAAVMTALVGVVDIVSAVTPGIAARMAHLAQVLPVHIHYGHLAAALAGIGLILVSRGLWRRQRVAWLMTIALLGVSAVSHVLKGLDYEEAIVATTLLVWLLMQSRAFHARSDGPSLARGLRVLATATIGTLLYGTAGFYFLDHHFSVNFSLVDAVRQTVVMFTQYYDPGLQPITGFGRYFADSIYVFGALTGAYALIELMRPVLERRSATAEMRSRARVIVEEWGNSSLAAMALLPDKSYFFSDAGSVVAYAVRDRYCLALGDVIGPPADRAAAVAAYTAMCDHNGWVPIFYQTLPDDLPVYRAAGFVQIHVGSEAVVDVTTFALEGKSKKSIRNRIHRLDEDGYSAVVHQPPVSDALMRELRLVSDSWLGTVGGKEKGYSLGWFLPEYISACPIMAVHAPDGSVVAFANVVSEYRRSEATIDLMRHLPEAPAGTMDYMFVRLFEWCRDTVGCKTFNLGLSALSDVGGRPDDRIPEKAIHLLYDYLNRFYSFQGLHDYKAKFDPTWEPRYLVYPAAANLLMVFYALISADAGESPLKAYLRPLFGTREGRGEIASSTQNTR